VLLPERRAVRILVAEDHDVNQLLIREMLERLGHRIDLVPDGAAAVAAVASAASHDPYDLVLMDMQMPGMDGVEATRAIRASGAHPQSLPIIALTANAYADDIAACLGAGMQAHLAKPLDDAELDAVIRRWAPREGANAGPVGAARFSPLLRERYAARRGELIDHIAWLAEAGRVGDRDVANLLDMLHKFLGSAEMFGDGRLAVEARTLEAALAAVDPEERAEALRRATRAMAKAA
jgi:CheY-like chemotaxis protein